MKRAAAPDWERYYDALFRRQMDEQVIKAVDKLTGRDMYEQATTTGTAKYLVNRPVTYALHGTEINYPVEPQDVMRDCLIDGFIVLRVQDPSHIRKQEHVQDVEYDDSGLCNMIRIVYKIDNPANPGNSDDYLLYKEEWYRYWDTMRGRFFAWVFVYNTVKREEDWVVSFDYVVPYWPFVAIRWVDDESIIEQVKKTIIRLEGVTVHIETENTRHSGRKLFIVGMKREQNKKDPRDTEDRINYLPEGAEAYYVDSDTGGVSLMFEEQEKLDEYIERTTGVISIKQLSGLSGESRQIAETPLVQLAEEIRTRFEKGMEKVVAMLQDFFGITNTEFGDSPDLEINHRFLRVISDKEQHLKIIEVAYTRGAITDEEEITEYRRLLNLSNKDPQALLAARAQRQAKLEAERRTATDVNAENFEENGNA